MFNIQSIGYVLLIIVTLVSGLVSDSIIYYTMRWTHSIIENYKEIYFHYFHDINIDSK